MRRLTLMLACTALAAGCALNRPRVKSLRDPGAGQVRLDTVIPTTVAALDGIAPHCGPAGNRRSRPQEFQVYQVVGRITRAKREPDHDIHLVLQDPDNPRAHLVVESNDPDFHGNAKSLYRDRLANARRMFDAMVRESGVRQLKDLRGTLVKVTGVGFFDMNHFQLGRSRSCIELHPILAIERILPSDPLR